MIAIFHAVRPFLFPLFVAAVVFVESARDYVNDKKGK